MVRYYTGLRVVYELESRVHELESATDSDTPAANETPQAADPSPANQAQPENAAPAKQPEDSTPRPAARKQTPPAHSRGNAGNSRREGLRAGHMQVVAEHETDAFVGNRTNVRTGRTTV